MRFADTPATDCPLCAQAGHALYTGLHDRWHGAPGTYTLRECPACRLVWIDPRPAAAALAEVNTGEYYTHTATTGSSDSPAKRLLLGAAAVLPIVRELIGARTMFLPEKPDGPLLDVGCGNGAFLAVMQQRGWPVAGVEPDAAAARIATRTLGREVFAGALEDAPLPEGQFAAVTMSHVIEHVPEPVQTLQTCLRLLRPGGALYLATPNTASLGRRVFGRDWLHWDPPRHLFLFNAGNLREVFRRAGWPQIEVRTLSRGARWSWRASHAIRQSGRLVPQSRSLDKLRAAAFHLREHLLADAQSGEELFVRAAKP